MSIQFTPDTPATRQAFNRLAREKMKLRLLADIRMDLMICELEGWNKLEYLDELLALVQELRKGGGEMREDMQAICDSLCCTLQQTSLFCDLLDLKYIIEDNGKQRVMAIFPGGYVYVNVTGDSGWAMAFDILKQLPRKI